MVGEGSEFHSEGASSSAAGTASQLDGSDRGREHLKRKSWEWDEKQPFRDSACTILLVPQSFDP